MTVDRRKVLAGLAGLGAASAAPAWAQFGNAIQPQNDPWAQVDPYADPRNGHPSQPARPFGETVPGGAGAPPLASAPQGGTAAPQPPTDEELAANDLSQIMTNPEPFEIAYGKNMYYNALIRNPGKVQGPILQHVGVQDAMRRFCAPFFAASERSHLPWQVFVTDHPSMNGFACAGGKMAITSGMIAYSDHPGELAAVVAHEIGHVDFRHTMRTIETQALMTINRSQGPKVESAQGRVVMDELTRRFESVLIRGYTRDDEFEADGHVATLMPRLGMDPGRQLVAWRKMMKLYNISPDEKTCLMDTHPVMMERIDALRNIMGGDGNPRAQWVPPGWAELKRYLPTPPDYRWG